MKARTRADPGSGGWPHSLSDSRTSPTQDEVDSTTLGADPLIGHRVLVDVLPVWVWSDYI